MTTRFSDPLRWLVGMLWPEPKPVPARVSVAFPWCKPASGDALRRQHKRFRTVLSVSPQTRRRITL